MKVIMLVATSDVNYTSNCHVFHDNGIILKPNVSQFNQYF